MPEARKVLRELRTASVLDAVDMHVTMRLGHRSGEMNPDVLTALALAVRAPRHGHICVDLQNVDICRLRPPEAEGPHPNLPTNRQAWMAAVADSPLVRSEPTQAARPFHIDGSRLYTDRYWHYQQQVTDRLLALAARPLRTPRDPAQMQLALQALFQPPGQQPETHLNRQRLAGAVAALKDLTVITGGPGMGKTWTVRNILALALLDHPDDAPALRIALAAPSGKAAVRMREALAEDLRAGLLPALSSTIGPNQAQTIAGRILRLEAVTIHKLLGWQPASPTRFKHHRDRPLVHDLVVIDECSMIDLAMMAKLLDAIGPHTRLVLIGDPHQLASVEAGTVLADICEQTDGDTPAASQAMQVALRERTGLAHTDTLSRLPNPGLGDAIVRFNKNHRFSEHSPIGQCARACLAKPVDVDKIAALFQPGTELERLDHDNGKLSAEAILRIRQNYQPLIDTLKAGQGSKPGAVFHRQILESFAAHRVLCAHRRGALGATQINAQLTQILGPDNAGRQPYWQGQPIIVTVNDPAVGRANGDVGVVVEVEGVLMAAFPGPDAIPADGTAPPEHLNLVEYLSLARLPDHETCFAMTIHKAQGSQWGRITVVLPDQPSPILTRELIYTAITRAKNMVTVLGAEEILAHALSTPIQRASGLAAQLQAQASQCA